MVVSPTPNPKLEDRPLLSVRGCLFKIFTANLHCWRQFLHPQPEDFMLWGTGTPSNMGMRRVQGIISELKKKIQK
jgi:hypothetical protein